MATVGPRAVDDTADAASIIVLLASDAACVHCAAGTAAKGHDPRPSAREGLPRGGGTKAEVSANKRINIGRCAALRRDRIVPGG